MNTLLIFAILGPLFLLAGSWRYLSAGELVPQAKTFLTIGVVFCAVAAWLQWGRGLAG